MIVKAVATVKIRSEVSDNAIDSLLKLFCHHQADIRRLLRTGELFPNYRKCIRPKALEFCPAIMCAYVLERKYAGDVTQIEKDGLETIPANVLNLPNHGTRCLLRTEAYVSIRAIKKHHIMLHKGKISDEMIRNQLQNADMSADGVRESAKGARSFTILSIRFGRCIYIVSVVNPLLGVRHSKPSPTELLR